jgi:hypothetical protein
MNTPVFVKRSFLLSSTIFLLASTVSPFSTHAEDGQVQGAMIVPVPVPQVASGAVEDSLKACLARIPEKASVGQRLLAERTCQGEDGSRKAMNDAPQF